MTTPERDIQAEQDHAEFTGWAEAQGYGDERYDFEEMEFAFTSGMEAERDPAAVAAHVASRERREQFGDAAPAEPQSAPELAAAMAETRALREVVTDMLATFHDAGDGHRARVGQVQIAKWRKRAGIEG